MSIKIVKLSNIFIHHQRKKIMVYGQITLLVTEIINLTFFVFEDVGEIFELETFGKQCLLFDFGFAVRIQCFQDVPVFAQAVVYVAHIRRFIFV